MKFYLGAHHAHWLAKSDVPLFVSRATLAKRKTFPRAKVGWALDSGGFTQLSQHGAWTIPPEQYVEEVRRFQREIGKLEWAAIQDWMCEPHILAKTGKTVAEHQRLTIENYETLLRLAPELPWAPVLQGWTRADYLSHLAQYRLRGHDLAALPVVGIGSVCRQQPLAPLTDVTGCSLLPTPTATDSRNGANATASRKPGSKHHSGVTPVDAVRLNYPTPTARDWRSPGTLEGRARRKAASSRGEPLTEVVGGLLNPTWVEWLMGFPEDWTET